MQPPQPHAADYIPAFCSIARPCRRFKVCARCARLRQASAADLAEKLEKLFGPLALTVITPEKQTAEALAAVRSRYMEMSKAPAGIWSIECGDQRGTMHTNIIHPLAKPASPRGAATHTSALRFGPRVAGAYIVKPKQFPDSNLYTGRTFGRCGPLMSYLAQDTENPLIQAAAMNQLLETNPPKKPEGFMMPAPRPAGELTNEEYHQIALRHLPNLAALALILKKEPLPKEQHDEIKRSQRIWEYEAGG